MTLKRFSLFLAIIILPLGITIFWGYETLRESDTSLGRKILRANDGTILSRVGLKGGYQIAYQGGLDTSLIQGIIEIEDHRFYQHSGIDIFGKIGAIQANLQAGTIVRGGSTITEQYIKNRYFRGEKRTYIQKIKEGLLALMLESITSKDDILRGYIDSIYMGNGLYGIGTAMEEYYHTDHETNLSESEKIELIMRIKYPNAFDQRYFETIKKRLGKESLEIGGYTNYTRGSYVIDHFPILRERIESERKNFCEGSKNELIRFMKDEIPQNICNSASWELTLSVDAIGMKYGQQELEAIIRQGEKENINNGAIFVTRPQDQKVLIYIGNREQGEHGKHIDMITERRSIGSILKPFIYLLALKNGADTEDLILDSKRAYPTEKENTYFFPENYVPKSYGPVRIREALGNSLNSATVRITETLGLAGVYDFLKSNGADLNHEVSYYGYGISLGTPELTLENIVNMYQNLVDQKDINSYLIGSTLSDGRNRAKTFGISSILETSIPLSVKTGTSTDFRDNWTVSYHDDAIIGIWIGNTDGSSMGDISGVSGSGPLWKKIAEHLIRRGIIQQKTQSIPNNLHTVPICLDQACNRRELHLTKKSISPKSRILDHLYYSEDFYGILTEDEKKEWKILDSQKNGI